MSLPDMLSFIFFLTSAVYFFYGILVLSYNSRSMQHRVLFCSFLCLAWWAFAFTITNDAQAYETALLWRRLASVGWGIYYSLFLHYILILTERKALLQKYWLYLLLYLPAALNVFLYGIHEQSARASYHLLKTPFGWANIAGVTALDMAHFISYIGFTIASIILLFHWGLTAQERTKRKIALLIGSTTILALIIGTLTEHFLNAIFQVGFPQLGPTVIMIPAFAMIYCIRRYGLMRQMPKDATAARNQMLSGYVQARLFFYLAMASLFGSVVGFMVLFFEYQASLSVTLMLSVVPAVAGIIIYVVRNLDLKAEYKDIIVGVVTAAILPVLTVLVYEYTTIHLWNLPIIFVLFAIVFSNKKIIILTGVAVLFSLIWAWIQTPVLPLIFTSVDHAVRMIIMAGIFIFVLYANHIFKQAITENKEKANKEKLLSDIASVLMSVNDNNIDAKITEVMAMWGKNLEADCMDIYFLDDGQSKVKFAYRGCGGGVLSAVGKEKISAAAPGLSRLWDEGDPGSTAVNDFDGSERENRWAKKIKDDTLAIVPLKNADRIIGVVAIEKKAGRQEWQEGQQKTCDVVARMLTDVWLKIESDRKIRHDAYHDSLTGLPNRQYFTDRLKQAINMAMRTDKLVGVIFLDVDSFKYVNDNMGHAVGDLLLQEVGQRMRKSVREYDVVARFGGDEFLIMVPQADDIAGVERVAAKVLENLHESMLIRGQNLFISLSMGIAVFPMDGDEPDSLLKHADIAMYVAKSIGNGRYVLCSAAMKKDAHVSTTLTNDLYSALARSELFLYYQPQIETATGEITGAEALLRWKHPHLGMISPSIFIPLLEKNGQIGSIGAWVINQACLQNKRWQAAGLKTITVAVNLSPGQFIDMKLVEVVQNALEKSGLGPEFLELDVTESIAAHDSQNIAQTMERLKALGVKLTIDDFGIGFSSLDRFKGLPVDKLKIGMRFVHGIGSGDKDEEIIKVILKLGRAFAIKVLAKGVEDEKQLLFLRDNCCDEVQGYYCYKPMAAGKMREVLQKQLGEIRFEKII